MTDIIHDFEIAWKHNGTFDTAPISKASKALSLGDFILEALRRIALRHDAREFVGNLMKEEPRALTQTQGDSDDGSWNSYRQYVLRAMIEVLRGIGETNPISSDSSGASEAMLQRLDDLDRSWPAIGSRNPLITSGFVREMLHVFSKQDSVRQMSFSTTVCFPVVKVRGKLAKWSLERLPLPLKSRGSLFIRPRDAFLPLDTKAMEMVKSALDAAAEILKEEHLLGDHDADLFLGYDVRLGIEWDGSDGRPLDALLGPSSGGALALGLLCVATRTELEPGTAVSAQIMPNGDLLAVTHEDEKYDASVIDKKCTRLVGGALDGQDEPLPGLVKAGKLRRCNHLLDAMKWVSTLVGVRTYLQNLQSVAAEMPFYLRGRQLSNIKVRVRVSNQPLRGASSREGSHNDLLDQNTRYETSSQRQEAKLIADNAPRFEVKTWGESERGNYTLGAVLGEAGQGKSTWAKIETDIMCHDALTKLGHKPLTEIPIPIYCRFVDLIKTFGDLKYSADDDKTHFVNAIADQACKQVDEVFRESLHQVLTQRMNQSRDSIQLYLDGLDEITQLSPEGLRRALRSWVETHQQHEARLLITSRTVGYTSPWNLRENQEIQILAFDTTQIEDCVARYFGKDDRKAQAVLTLLRGDNPRLRGMAAVPLLLALICWLFDSTTEMDPEAAVHRHLRRGELYKQCVEKLFYKEHRGDEKTPESDWEDDVKVLSELALATFSGEKEVIAEDDLRLTIRDLVTMGVAGLPENKIGETINQWARERGCLVREFDKEDKAIYVFTHLTFQEYFAALALAHRFRNAKPEVKDKAQFWDRVLAQIPRAVDALASGGDNPKQQPEKLPDIPKARACYDLLNFIDKKAWDPRWQEVIILLIGCLMDLEREDVVIAILKMLSDESRDDYSRHRLALAALCLPEIPFEDAA